MSRQPASPHVVTSRPVRSTRFGLAGTRDASRMDLPVSSLLVPKLPDYVDEIIHHGHMALLLSGFEDPLVACPVQFDLVQILALAGFINQLQIVCSHLGMRKVETGPGECQSTERTFPKLIDQSAFLSQYTRR